jgi:hypothetical protein
MSLDPCNNRFLKSVSKRRGTWTRTSRGFSLGTNLPTASPGLPLTLRRIAVTEICYTDDRGGSHDGADSHHLNPRDADQQAWSSFQHTFVIFVFQLDPNPSNGKWYNIRQ